jgi:hypothetical protein
VGARRGGSLAPLQRFTEQSMLSMLTKAGLIFVTGHIVFVTLALFLAS